VTPRVPAELSVGLPAGLHLRSATPEDVDRLVALHTVTSVGDPSGFHVDADRAHLEDLLVSPHPTFRPGDMTVVEEEGSGRIVSSQHLSHQRWSYEGVEFEVGEVEHVATHPDHRRRGLVRRQMGVMHGWSAERGQLATAVNGIPWYYSQFGYDLALAKYGGRSLLRWAVPTVGTGEPFTLRPATTADVGFIAGAFAAGQRRYALSTTRPAETWAYEIGQRRRVSTWKRDLYVIDEAPGRPAGFVSVVPRTLGLDAFELRPGVAWAQATPAVARALVALAEQREHSGAPRIDRFSWDWLGEHPSFAAVPALFGHPETLGTPFRRAAWYVRIPDRTRFLRHIAPALQQRLAASACAGFTGALRLSFYRLGGVRLDVDRGHVTVSPWAPEDIHDGDGRFADDTFVHLLLGHRSLDELEDQYPFRVGVSHLARAVLDALFPRRPSYLLPVY